METSVKTIGGSPFFSNFSIPTKVDNADINLSQWVSSLNDKNTHTGVSVVDVAGCCNDCGRDSSD